MEKIEFVKLNPVNSSSEDYFVLYRDGVPSKFVYSESQLKLAYKFLNDVFGFRG